MSNLKIIESNRAFISLSGAKLRRARNLYKFIIAPVIHENPRVALLICKRAMDAGLFSEGNSMNDVVFSFIRAAYKRFNNMESWHQYTDRKQITFLWFEARLYYKKTKKGYIQTRKVCIRC